MTNIMETGATWLGEQFQQCAAVTIVYARGRSTVSVTAHPAMHEYEVVDEDGIVTVHLSRDYILHRADLIIAGDTITPRPGDRITETIADVSQEFEVLPIADRKEWEPLDAFDILIRVHTKKVA